MQKTRLYIENNEVELDSSVQFAITKQFEDLSDPTAIINDWSKTVSLPFTENNNKLFGHIYNPNRVITTGGSSNVGIYFDPYKKLNFRLEWDGNVIMQGYAKMNSIARKQKGSAYNITLNGELGKLFQELKKITFDATTYASGSTEYNKYYIDGSQFFKSTISANVVAQSWDSNGQTSPTIIKRGQSGYSFTNILGFAPNESFNTDFDYKSFLTKENGNTITKKFTDVLAANNFKTNSGIDPDTAIPNGMTPRGIGEYRSYLQLPFIYWNKLWQIFQEKGEALTGYTFQLDSDWFNTNNPYWYNLAYMLEPITDFQREHFTNVYSVGNFTDTIPTGSQPPYKYGYVVPATHELAFTATETYPGMYNPTTHRFDIPDDESQIYFDINFNFEMGVTFTLNKTFQSDTTIRMNPDVGLELLCYAVDETDFENDLVASYIVTGEDTNIDTSDYFQHLTISPQVMRNTGDTISSTRSAQSDNLAVATGYKAKLRWKYNFIDLTGASYVNVMQYKINNSTWGAVTLGPLSINGTNTGGNIKVVERYSGGNREVTLNDFWNNEYNLFDAILNYCKTYHIIVEADDHNKVLKFTPAKKYFNTPTIEDWTDKLDTSKDIDITPITLEDKYILFNYEDNDTSIAQKYLESYGDKYGEYKITTEYNFNTETKDLFKGLKQSIVYTPTVLSWNNLYTYSTVFYSFPAETYVCCSDEDNKYKSPFGQMYFDVGKASFDFTAGLRMRSVEISEDNRFQAVSNTYCYGQAEVTRYEHIFFYRKLSNWMTVGNDTYFASFGIPKKNYTYETIGANPKSIYSQIWANYISERYNIQNKKVTCYLFLTPTDYTNFKFNKFIKIENQLYFVNKIYDYDLSSTNPTKVDLITIQDISKYKV